MHYPDAPTAVGYATQYRLTPEGKTTDAIPVTLKHMVENAAFERECLMYGLCAEKKIFHVGRLLESGGIDQYFPKYWQWCLTLKQTIVLPRYDAISKVLTLQSYGRYVEQLLEFLVAMDEHGLVHLDIRPENIVWNAALDEIVVIDFELMRQLQSDGYCLLTVDDKVGCHPIIAPEMDYDLGEHGEHLCSSLCDVYSAGVTADLWWEQLGDKAQALPKALTLLIACMTERERKNRISAGAAFKQFQEVKALLKGVPSPKKQTDKVLAKEYVPGNENDVIINRYSLQERKLFKQIQGAHSRT